MDPIRKMIQQLLGLSDEEMPKAVKDAPLEGFTVEQLTEAAKLARENFTAARNDRDIVAGEAYANTVTAIATEQAARAKAEADLDEKFASLESEIAVTDSTDGDGDDGEGDGSGDGEGENKDEGEGDGTGSGDGSEGDGEGVNVAVVAETETEEVATTTPEPVNVAASTTNAANSETGTVTAATPVTPKITRAVPKPSSAKTSIKPKRPLVTITAAADLKGVDSGSEMQPEDIIDPYIRKAEALTKGRKPGRLDVATLHVKFPDDRSLDRDPVNNDAKIAKLVASAQEESRKNLDAILAAGDMKELMSLTAAGGLCAPVNVRYEIFELGTDRRPLRDALLRFGATRGGIRFNEPPVLADVDGAANVYTEAQDAAGTDYPKDCIRVDCGDEVEVKVSAIPLCMEVGNFQRLSFPENFRAWWKLGKVAHSRLAETYIWNGMVALSLALSSATDGLGTARQVLAAIARGAQQYRDRFRLGDEAVIRAYIPSWLVVMMQVDFLRQAPGDNALNTARAAISRYFANFGVATTYVLDGQASSPDGYDQEDDAPLNPWPETVDIIFTVDGTFIHLDMGTLDFGTEIRDFTQIRQNDSGAFFETFENVARVGPQAGRLRLTGLCSSGLTSGVSDDIDAICANDY
jgi:hypothetical protein